MRRISPALILSICAVVLASTGSAIASHLITGKQIKNGTIQLRDLSKSARKALKGKRGRRGATGHAGLAGAQGRQGNTGAAGKAGPQGPAGPVSAFGRVLFSDGSIDSGVSHDLAKVAHPATGTYCLDDTAATAHSAQATIDVAQADSRKARAEVSTSPATISGEGCPSPTDIVVLTTSAVGGTGAATPADEGFYVAVTG